MIKLQLGRSSRRMCQRLMWEAIWSWTDVRVSPFIFNHISTLRVNLRVFSNLQYVCSEFGLFYCHSEKSKWTKSDLCLFTGDMSDWLKSAPLTSNHENTNLLHTLHLSTQPSWRLQITFPPHTALESGPGLCPLRSLCSFLSRTKRETNQTPNIPVRLRLN